LWRSIFSGIFTTRTSTCLLLCFTLWSSPFGRYGFLNLMPSGNNHTLSKAARGALLLLALLLLVLIYVFQRTDFRTYLLEALDSREHVLHPYVFFVFNKTFRLMLNDACCFLLILALFGRGKYMKAAFYVFLFELLVLLPVYFLLKLNLEGDAEISSPLLSQLHRLIINPTLMFLLIIAFFYQRFKEGRLQL
jgi:exosortase F-associated protein